MICETNNEADMREAMHELGLRALRASRALAVSDSASRSRWLLVMADALERDTDIILAANAEDLAEAKRNGLDAPKLERLIDEHQTGGKDRSYLLFSLLMLSFQGKNA